MKNLIDKKFFIFLSSFIISSIVLISCSSPLKADGIYAEIKTNKGDITCKLFYDKVPIAVANFVGLVEGTREFTDVANGEKVKRPFYNGLIFHRVIKDFVIQGGCPNGNGSGGPGYNFIDQIDPQLKHDSAGVLAYANSGPNTNGSQFYITLKETPHLDGKYTIFGKVVDGLSSVMSIGNVKVDDNKRPYESIFIKEIKIIRKGDAAKAFDAEIEFAKNEEALKQLEKEKEEKSKQFLKTIGVDESRIITTNIGLKYFVLKAGTGKKPKKGDIIVAHYSGYLQDGTKFDSSYDRQKPIEIKIGVGQVIPGWDEALVTMREGEKRVLILPYYLGYGESGHPPVIPPKATLIFDVELVKVK